MTTELTTATTDDATGQDTPANGGTAGKTFSQAEVDALIKERLDRQKRAIDADAEKGRRQAEEAALAEQGKWKEIAEAHAAEISRLSPAAARVSRLEAVLEKQLQAALVGIPDHIKPLLDKLDVAERLEYLAEHRAALLPPQDTAGGIGTPRAGARPSPQGVVIPAPKTRF